jgi:hypothetical protein
MYVISYTRYRLSRLEVERRDVIRNMHFLRQTFVSYDGDIRLFLSPGGNSVGREFGIAVNMHYCCILASFVSKADALLN